MKKKKKKKKIISHHHQTWYGDCLRHENASRVNDIDLARTQMNARAHACQTHRDFVLVLSTRFMQRSKSDYYSFITNSTFLGRSASRKLGNQHHLVKTKYFISITYLPRNQVTCCIFQCAFVTGGNFSVILAQQRIPD